MIKIDTIWWVVMLGMLALLLFSLSRSLYRVFMEYAQMMGTLS